MEIRLLLLHKWLSEDLHEQKLIKQTVFFNLYTEKFAALITFMDLSEPLLH